MLNHEQTKKHSEKITKVKPFLDNYNWEGINYPSKKDDWKKFEKNDQRLLLMFCILKRKIYLTYVSKHNPNCEKQVIILMIWRKMALCFNKKLPVLLRGITSKHHGNFIVLIVFILL